jgi:hypothetical protein
LETCNSLRKNLHGYFRKLGVFVPFLNWHKLSFRDPNPFVSDDQ